MYRPRFGAAGGRRPYMTMNVPRPNRVNIDDARKHARLEVHAIEPYHVSDQYTGGRVRALFIGINYTGTSAELSGCVNDVTQIMETLEKIEFPIQECCILVDDPHFPNVTATPTRDNIVKYIAWLTNDVQSGDVLFLHYSGHGGTTPAKDDSQEANDQCLIPLDYTTAGTILDDDLFDMLVKPLPAGVRLTCVFDCCHSATMLDLPFSFVGGNSVSGSSGKQEMQAIRNDNFCEGDVIMISGCEDAQTSADVQNISSFGNDGTGAGGAATQAFTWALQNTEDLTFLDILLKTRDVLAQKGYTQVPQLTSSKPADLYKPFSLFGTITVNEQMMEQYVPQRFRRHPPPQINGIPARFRRPGFGPGGPGMMQGGPGMMRGAPMPMQGGPMGMPMRMPMGGPMQGQMARGMPQQMSRGMPPMEPGMETMQHRPQVQHFSPPPGAHPRAMPNGKRPPPPR